MRIPSMTDRTLMLGRTGSGKTVFSMFLLSQQDFMNYPWTIIDYKQDELIDAVFKIKSPYIHTLKVGAKPPKKPGLYRLCPDIVNDDEAVNEYLYAVYRQENHGIFIDEGYAIPNARENKPLNAIFTQGRARNTPVICCYQRPVYMSRFAVAQASFISHFEEDDDRDLKTSQQFMRAAVAPDGSKVTVFTELPKYQSLWYDVSKGKTVVLSPCPDDKEIVRIFQRRLGASSPQRKIGAIV